MSGAKAALQPDSDVHITFEDQQRINKFARLNAKLEDLKEEMKQKQKDLQRLEEAGDEILLLDDDEKVPYLVGELFVFQDIEKTQVCIDSSIQTTSEQISDLECRADKIKDMMGDLKSYLYGKFGNNINLEAEEE